MKTLLRRALMALLADEIEAMLIRELVNSETRTWLDGEEVSRIADRQIRRHMSTTWGKD